MPHRAEEHQKSLRLPDPFGSDIATVPLAPVGLVHLRSRLALPRPVGMARWDRGSIARRPDTLPIAVFSSGRVTFAHPLTGLQTRYRQPTRRRSACGLRLGIVVRQARGVAALFLSYDRRIDLLVGVLWLLALLAWFRIQVPPIRRCAANLAASAIFFALYWIIPFNLGSTAAADVRVLPALFICLLAVLGELPARRMLLGGLLLAACILVRQIEVELAWNRIGGRLQSYSQVFQDFPSGGKVLPVILLPSWGVEYVDRHFHDWAAVERDVFLPGLWTIPGQILCGNQSSSTAFARTEKTSSKARRSRSTIRNCSLSTISYGC